jgi:Concanavalin A-like lectin/glucanases superfamily
MHLGLLAVAITACGRIGYDNLGFEIPGTVIGGGAAGAAGSPDASLSGMGGGGGGSNTMGGQAGLTSTGAGGASDGGGTDQATDARADANGNPPVDAASDGGCAAASLCALKAALVHRYRFDGTGTTATDSVGTAHGTVVNTQLSGSGSVTLAGAGSQFVELPSGIVSQLTNATLEVWVTWNGGGGWQRIFDFGDSVATKASTTLYLTPKAGASPNYTGPATLLTAFKRADQTTAQELNVWAASAMTTGTVVHVAVVVDDGNNQIALYRNGMLETASAFADSLSLLNDVNNRLGQSQYSGDPEFGGTIFEFRIYNVALSASAIQASFAAGPDPAGLN